jgi:hypothetical protein
MCHMPDSLRVSVKGEYLVLGRRRGCQSIFEGRSFATRLQSTGIIPDYPTSSLSL